MPYAPNRTDRAKAITLVVALHAALGAALVLGLAGGSVTRVTDALKSFDVLEPPPPPRSEPPPTDRSESAAKEEAAAPDLRANPAPVVAPKPPRPLPVPSPVRTSDERAPVEGADRSAGAAAVAGPGSGAGGSGSGFGGGGSGGTGTGAGGLGREARYVPGTARARLPRSVLMTAPSPSGRLPLRLSITPRGRVGSCAPLATSGSVLLDAELCRSVTRHSRWVPALDRSGRPVTVELVFNATWSDR